MRLAGKRRQEEKEAWGSEVVFGAWGPNGF